MQIFLSCTRDDWQEWHWSGDDNWSSVEMTKPKWDLVTALVFCSHLSSQCSCHLAQLLDNKHSSFRPFIQLSVTNIYKLELFQHFIIELYLFCDHFQRLSRELRRFITKIHSVIDPCVSDCQWVSEHRAVGSVQSEVQFERNLVLVVINSSCWSVTGVRSSSEISGWKLFNISASDIVSYWVRARVAEWSDQLTLDTNHCWPDNSWLWPWARMWRVWWGEWGWESTWTSRGQMVSTLTQFYQRFFAEITR